MQNFALILHSGRNWNSKWSHPMQIIRLLWLTLVLPQPNAYSLMEEMKKKTRKKKPKKKNHLDFFLKVPTSFSNHRNQNSSPKSSQFLLVLKRKIRHWISGRDIGFQLRDNIAFVQTAKNKLLMRSWSDYQHPHLMQHLMLASFLVKWQKQLIC